MFQLSDGQMNALLDNSLAINLGIGLLRDTVCAGFASLILDCSFECSFKLTHYCNETSPTTSTKVVGCGCMDCVGISKRIGLIGLTQLSQSRWSMTTITQEMGRPLQENHIFTRMENSFTM